MLFARWRTRPLRAMTIVLTQRSPCWFAFGKLTQNPRRAIDFALRVASIFSPILAVDLVFRGESLASSIKPWELTELQAANSANAQWDCTKAWNILWPLAKAGNPEARYALWSFTIFNTNPPGADRNSPSEIISRHKLILSAYGSAASWPPEKTDATQQLLRNSIPIYIQELALDASGIEVIQCYRSARQLPECLDLAVSRKVVPKFADYVDEVDAIIRQTGHSASCWRPH